MDAKLPNFKELNGTDGKVYGRYNTVTSINPYTSKFIAHYPDGRTVFGNNLFQTGWDSIPDGLCKLEYSLSSGHLIEIPKYRAYMPLIETSLGTDGSRIFHAINVKCLADNCVVVYRIILRQDNYDKFKIGDIIVGREKTPEYMSKSWKYTS